MWISEKFYALTEFLAKCTSAVLGIFLFGFNKVCPPAYTDGASCASPEPKRNAQPMKRPKPFRNPDGPDDEPRAAA